MELKFNIPMQPVTKKNSQRLIRRGERIIPLPSRAFEAYQEAAGYCLHGKHRNLTEPCNVKAEFYMGTRRKVDLVNLLEALDDILVHYGVLEDDNCGIIVSHDGSRVHYDKENPRTEVTITWE